MENTLRPTDFIGRWNQNEFLAILIECDESEAALVAQRVRQTALQCKVEWWGDSLPLNLSTGSATARQSDTVEKIIDRAEEQLRVALIEDAQVNS
jgi:diguanylate cyclase (GGDEF)-like protein